MKYFKIFFIFLYLFFVTSCTTLPNNKTTPEKTYFSSSGFALVYEDSLFEKKIINKKINNEKIIVLHNILNSNTLIKLTNPINSKSITTKIFRKAEYPTIFNVTVSKKVSDILELDLENPYLEITEVKKNKTFIAKKSETFEEEKNVSEKAPVDEVKMDDLVKDKIKIEEKKVVSKNFILVISDFYYLDSANNLKKELLEKTKISNIFVKKINNNKYRLLVGPFKNFNALKTTYISLNNLGFENLNIFRE